jgi:hypothetical protein
MREPLSYETPIYETLTYAPLTYRPRPLGEPA